MASSNASPAEKSCACAYIAFLAGIFSCYADSSSVWCVAAGAFTQQSPYGKQENLVDGEDGLTPFMVQKVSDSPEEHTALKIKVKMEAL
jgi:hypothetical protein